MDKTLEGKASEVEQLDLKLQAECARSKQLEFEIGQLRSDIEQSSLATTNIQQESESALQLMRQDLADARDGYKKAESIISDLKVELAATRDEALASRSLVDENGAKISEMESALQDAKVAADTLKVDLSRAQSDLAATKEHHTSSTQELRDSLAVQEELISSLNSKLCDANIRAEHAEDTKLESDQRNANTIERLRESLQSQRKLQQEQDVAQRSALAEKDMSITHIQKQHDLQAGQHKLEISSIRHELDEKTHTIASLRKELETCREHIVSQETKRMELQEKSVLLESTKKELIEKHQREMALLTAKLQKTETDLAMANDDIRDLRLFDLKEAEETISALNAEIRALNQRGDSTKLQVSEALADKEAQLSSLRSRVSGLERSATLQDQIVARKQCEILSLQSEKASLAGELKEKYAKLQERHTCIANLTVRNAELEERERESVSRLQAMAAEQSKMQTTHEKELQTMKCVIQKHLTNHEDDETEHQQKQARLAREVAETEAKAEKAREKVDELETILEGRTQLLSDMVAHNKQTEDDKTRALGELKELKGLLERLTREKSEMEVEKAELTSEFRRKEDQFLETVQNERQLREIAESNLEDANSRLSRTSRDDKEVRELEKENALLKDKVRRQEAHLQRKLEKDKVLRERSTNRVVALPQNRRTKKATSVQKKSSSSSRRAPLRDNNGGSSVRPSGVPRVPSLIQPRSSESTRSINSHALSPMSADLEEVLGHRKTY
uniref:Uncharacterized protein n=1 Tax=Grammatophora oceanica TaxID=210454 RepID=A0A7S1Y500_9STRA